MQINKNNSVNQSNNLTKENLNSTINNENEINNSSGDNGSFNDLQNTINSLPDNSVLNLDQDYSYNETGDFTGIIVSKNNFIIDDHGHTLDANSKNNIVRIFNITGSKVTLKNLVLKNANVKTKDGGAITNTGQSLNINNITFINNKAHYGVVIQNYGTQLIINSDFTNNQAGCGGAINNNANKSSIYDSSFTQDTVSTYGGAICNDGNSFTIDNSTFNNNMGNQKGGVIQNNHGTDVIIKNSVFTNIMRIFLVV